MRWRTTHQADPADHPRLAWYRPPTWSPLPPVARACCCPGTPAVQVVIPPTTQRPEAVELLLCEHHYRQHREALHAAGAVSYAADGLLLEVAPETMLFAHPYA